MTASPSVALVDYGAGNLRSVAKALERSGFRVDVTAEPAAVHGADCVVLPGVGAFADAVRRLDESGLTDSVKEAIEDGRPYLGICLGLQLLFDEGREHGTTKGLQELRGVVDRFPALDLDGSRLRVPQIGWNEVRYRGAHPMLESLPASDYYYFVHSYRAEPADPGVVVGTADYGGPYCAAAATERVFAVQFHPEKSQRAGKRLLDAFLRWTRQA